MGGFLPEGTFRTIRKVLKDKDKLKKIADLLGAEVPADVDMARIEVVFEHTSGSGKPGGQGDKGKTK